MVATCQEETHAPPPQQHRYSITSGFEIRAQIIWAKDRFALSRGVNGTVGGGARSF
jgi:hypothetical protein